MQRDILVKKQLPQLNNGHARAIQPNFENKTFSQNSLKYLR